uniref:Clathrin/coatomer adaptor adaptin-like N-terminal domain-containing protein n=1 Tax=Fundulus heteroclitus TaxID=8078 RepID=A0A3Q2QLT9_FUNHE
MFCSLSAVQLSPCRDQTLNRVVSEERCGSAPAEISSVLRNEDLKEMLESNKESLKLEAMKRIVQLISKGKKSSDLFPAVVKNVASKNIELKKLVYVYLVRYAEEQQDLALLSISTFQRALKVTAASIQYILSPRGKVVCVVNDCRPAAYTLLFLKSSVFSAWTRTRRSI